jgi:hypothetical protein
MTTIRCCATVPADLDEMLKSDDYEKIAKVIQAFF